MELWKERSRVLHPTRNKGSGAKGEGGSNPWGIQHVPRPDDASYAESWLVCRVRLRGSEDQNGKMAFPHAAQVTDAMAATWPAAARAQFYTACRLPDAAAKIVFDTLERIEKTACAADSPAPKHPDTGEPLWHAKVDGIRAKALTELATGAGLTTLVGLDQEARGHLRDAGYDLGKGIVPTINFLGGDRAKVQRILGHLADEDQTELRAALDAVPMGWLPVVGFAGSGKTHRLAIIVRLALANPRLDKIAAVGPTHTAIDNLAERIMTVLPGREPRPLVVRAYSQHQMGQLVGFYRGCHGARLPDEDWQPSDWLSNAPFRVRYTVTWWAAKIIGLSPELRLDAEDPAEAHGLREAFDDAARYPALADLMAGRHPPGGRFSDEVDALMTRIVRDAHVVCAHPSAIDQAHPEVTRHFRTAKMALIDEAGAILQGHALAPLTRGQPCIFGGDDLQLPPTVTTLREELADGVKANPWGPAMKISFLEKARCSEWPAHLCLTQRRMVQGNFDMSRDLVYKRFPAITYAPETALTRHPAAAEIETWFRGLFPDKPGRPPLATSPSGSIWPVFVHVAGSKTEQRGTSKANPAQARAVAELARGFAARFPDVSIGVLTPYRAQHARLKRALADTPALVSTIDGIQGREADVIIYNLVADASSSPGFVSNLARNNVAITRHRYFLAIVGDWNMQTNVRVAKHITNDDGSAGAVVSLAPLVDMKRWLGPTKDPKNPSQQPRKRVAHADASFKVPRATRVDVRDGHATVPPAPAPAPAAPATQDDEDEGPDF